MQSARVETTEATMSNTNTSPKKQSPNRTTPTKPELILKLISRKNGATMDDLQKATGWQAHSVRAGLTGLRKKDIQIDHNRAASGKAAYKVVKG